MDEMLFKSLESYFHALELKGYLPFRDMEKLLVLIFYRDFVMNDYRGLLSREDYFLIERALDCLYDSTCLIPYPDYLKMGKLRLGDMTEMAHRIKNLEDTNVLKVIHNPDDFTTNPESDIIFVEAERTEG